MYSLRCPTPKCYYNCMRKISFVNNEFYHVYNRGTDKRTIFMNDADFDRFLQSMHEFNSVTPIGSIFQNSFFEKQLLRRRTPKLVNIVCYCLNPNHYHFILEQCVDGGISEFIKRLGGGYTNYFNAQHKRSGVLFQGKFKANHIDSNEYLLHASSYVNLNNQVHKLKHKFFKSSWDEYLGKAKGNFCKKEVILNQFSSLREYQLFAQEVLDNALKRKESLQELDALLSLEK